MVDYTIYVLDEQDLSLSSTGLDGETQGDGSHLNGQTLTINAANWTPINITDNDVNFQDSDSSQTLNGPQEIDGTTYADGSVVEAEFSFQITNGTDVWTVVAFNVREPNSPYGNSYGSVEGIAIIGGPGDFPPAGEDFEIFNAQEGPSFNNTAYATPICFDAGSPILTPDGYVAVEKLRPGDLLMTADAGAQPVLWIGSRRAFGAAAFAPVEIAPGALGNHQRLRVSQQHRVLISGARAELLFGACEVLVPARALVGRAGVTLVEGCQVHYHHVLLPNHAILDCAGLATESFLPCTFGLAQLAPLARASLQAVVPDLSGYEPVRPLLRGYEAELLMAA
ncbi:MAG: Hint domain-containing protein [Pseudomonadota bacterium]